MNQRVLCIAHTFLVGVAVYLLCKQEHYNARSVLSTMVTFSNQVTVISAVGSVMHIVGIRMHGAMDVLALYNALIALVFYALIVPLNNGTSTMLDFVVHALAPLFFLMSWYNGKKSQVLSNRTLVFAYPACYFFFAWYISYRRGYWLYPLFNVPCITIVIVTIEALRKAYISCLLSFTQ